MMSLTTLTMTSLTACVGPVSGFVNAWSQMFMAVFNLPMYTVSAVKTHLQYVILMLQ